MLLTAPCGSWGQGGLSGTERTNSLVGDGVLGRRGTGFATADSVATLCTLWTLRVTVPGWCGMGTHAAGFKPIKAAPNKRLKLTGPALRGIVRLFTRALAVQG